MIFQVGQTYIDSRSRVHPEDQYNKWLTYFDPENGILSSINIFQGVKYLNYLNLRLYPFPAALIFETSLTSRKKRKITGKDFTNPWKDEISEDGESIKYWADAKYHPSKNMMDWNGCKKIKLCMDFHKKNNAFIPPVLHFTRVSVGRMLFNGVYGIQKICIDSFLDESFNEFVPNYLVSLKRLNTQMCDMQWIHDRLRLGVNASTWPIYWEEYINEIEGKNIDVTQEMHISENIRIANYLSKQSQVRDLIEKQEYLLLYTYVTALEDSKQFNLSTGDKREILNHLLSSVD